ncbi:hypothetical protein BGZ79_003513 [Entomortierella chlamydospora]|nr:hypothetical protein BGZ79_003513 [Entomortierella chlamydospora]
MGFSTYQEKDEKAFENAVEMNGGKYNSQLGRVIIVLKTRIRAEEFFDALIKARHVYDLDITFDWDCSKADLEAFEDALKVSNVSILRLDLRWFQASAASNFRVLVNSLKTNTTLTTLNLKDNSIGKEGALALSQSLKTNTVLTTLNLRNNSIGNEGALALLEALKVNATLTTLNSWGNSIGKEGALALSEALKTNTTLTTLDLEANSVGDEGALALSEALKANTTLATLRLRKNPIGNEGALALSEALKTNPILQIYW